MVQHSPQILSHAKEKQTVTYTDSSGATTATVHFDIQFDDYTALKFNMFVTIVTWIWTLMILGVIAATTLADSFTLPPQADSLMLRGSIFALLWCYTSTIATSAVASNCDNGSSNIGHYSDDSIKSDIGKFCSNVSCPPAGHYLVAAYGAFLLPFSALLPWDRDRWARAVRLRGSCSWPFSARW